MAIILKNFSAIKNNITFDYNLFFEMILLLNLLSYPDDYSHRDWAKAKRQHLSKEMVSCFDFWGGFERWYFILDLLTEKNYFATKNVAACLDYLDNIPNDDFINSLYLKKNCYHNADEAKFRKYISNNYEELLANSEIKINELKYFLRVFYNTSFLPLMEKVELKLVQMINEKLQSFNQLALTEFFKLFNNKMAFRNDELILNAWIKKTVDLAEGINKIIFMPTLFAAPHNLYDDSSQPQTIFIAFSTVSSLLLDHHLDNNELEYLSGTFRALGDSHRLQILAIIAQKPSTNQDLVRDLNLSKSTISKHITRLRQFNLVTGEYIGSNKILYQLGDNLIVNHLTQQGLLKKANR